GPLVGGKHRQGGAVGLAPLQETEQVAGGGGAVQREKAALGEEVTAQPDVVGAEERFAALSKDVFFETLKRVKIFWAEGANAVARHGSPSGWRIGVSSACVTTRSPQRDTLASLLDGTLNT